MAEVRVVKKDELGLLGLPAPLDRLEINVCMARLKELKEFYKVRGRATRVMFSNTEELLIRLPGENGEILYYGPMKGVDHD